MRFAGAFSGQGAWSQIVAQTGRDRTFCRGARWSRRKSGCQRLDETKSKMRHRKLPGITDCKEKFELGEKSYCHPTFESHIRILTDGAATLHWVKI